MIGDIILNKWASEDNPSRIAIITGHNNRYVNYVFPYKGKIKKGMYYLDDYRKDKEHFVKIGHIDLSKILTDLINEAVLKERENNG